MQLKVFKTTVSGQFMLNLNVLFRKWVENTSGYSRKKLCVESRNVKSKSFVFYNNLLNILFSNFTAVQQISM